MPTSYVSMKIVPLGFKCKQPSLWITSLTSVGRTCARLWSRVIDRAGFASQGVCEIVHCRWTTRGQPSIYAEVDIAMFRRKTVLTQGLCEEKSVYDSFNKLIAAQIRGTTISYFIMQNRIEYKEAECSLRSRIGWFYPWIFCSVHSQLAKQTQSLSQLSPWLAADIRTL